MSVTTAQMGQHKQGLAAGSELASPAADPATVRGQLMGEELKVRTGQVDRGWVDKHTKLLAMALLLVEKSSNRSFAMSPPRSPPMPSGWKGLSAT
ncbi:hypothetical protein GCM10010428_51460 [Actinosynnema pretiosum subsp. pretiosum]